MLQVSRDNSLKVPKQIEIAENNVNSVDDIIAIKNGKALADNKKIDDVKVLNFVNEIDKDLGVMAKIPSNANDLVVITIVKKLCCYVVTVTEKSPKKFRGVFVNRMQNYCLDTLECLLKANFIRMDTIDKKLKREEYQRDAIVKLKLLGYVAMVAESSGCILKRQYKQISIQLAEAISLTVAWKKSDDERWKKRNLDSKSKGF